MTLETIYATSKKLMDSFGSNKIELQIYLPKNEHESLQREMFVMNNNTLYNYESKENFNIIIKNIRFTIKLSST